MTLLVKNKYFSFHIKHTYILYLYLSIFRIDINKCIFYLNTKKFLKVFFLLYNTYKLLLFTIN